MTDRPMPDWMVEDVDGCPANVEMDPADEVRDEDVDDLVLTATIRKSDHPGADEYEAAKEARRAEYRALFPEATGDGSGVALPPFDPNAERESP